MPIAYEELAGSPSIVMDREGGSAKRTFKVAWSDIGRAILEVFPGARFGYPYTASMPGFPWLRATRMSIDPWDPERPSGHNEVINTYPAGAKIVVDYEPFRWPDPNGTRDGKNDGPGDPENVTFLEHRITYGGEYLTIPNNGVRWENDAAGNSIQPGVNDKQGGVFEDVNVGVVIPTIEHSLTWNYVGVVPWTGIRNCLGKVNKSLHMNCQPETLLFTGATAERTYSSVGAPTWKVEYRLSEKCMNYPLTIKKGARNPVIVNGGLGYKVSDFLFASGGKGTACEVQVTAVNPVTGAVTACIMSGAGAYSTLPANPNAVVGGTGAGCTIQFLFNVAVPDKPQGWNHFLRPGTGKFERMMRKFSSDGVYLLAEFRQLYGGRP